MIRFHVSALFFQVFFGSILGIGEGYFDVVANSLPLLINPTEFACEIDYLSLILFATIQLLIE